MSRKQREKRARAKSPGTTLSEPSAPTATKADASINKLGLIVAVVGLAGLFGLVVFLGDGPPPAPTPVSEPSDAEAEKEEPPVERWKAAFLQEVPIDPTRDFARGPADAAVNIVEFTDFECPFCKTAHTSLKKIVERYPTDVRIVYKNFPLDMACNTDMAQQLHPYACRAAVMARCAGKKDPELFWRFHDAIFEGGGFNDEWLDAKAAELGLAGEEFASCVLGREAFDEVRADIELARSLGVAATPTVYVNGRVAPSYQFDALVEVIDHILESN
jgi:protein-disulfide isomerase